MAGAANRMGSIYQPNGPLGNWQTSPGFLSSQFAGGFNTTVPSYTNYDPIKQEPQAVVSDSVKGVASPNGPIGNWQADPGFLKSQIPSYGSPKVTTTMKSASNQKEAKNPPYTWSMDSIRSGGYVNGPYGSIVTNNTSTPPVIPQNAGDFASYLTKRVAAQEIANEKLTNENIANYAAAANAIASGNPARNRAMAEYNRNLGEMTMNRANPSEKGKRRTDALLDKRMRQEQDVANLTYAGGQLKRQQANQDKIDLYTAHEKMQRNSAIDRETAAALSDIEKNKTIDANKKLQIAKTAAEMSNETIGSIMNSGNPTLIEMFGGKRAEQNKRQVALAYMRAYMAGPDKTLKPEDWIQGIPDTNLADALRSAYGIKE